MDPSSYKDVTVPRGFHYHTYLSPPRDGRPYVLLLHGFPNSSQDWRFQVPTLQAAGFGVVVPDLLGYGGSSKPVEVENYKGKALAQDIVAILDAEGIEKVVVVGHDWGSVGAGLLACYFPERFLGFGFLAVGYWAPSPPVKYEDMLAYNRKTVGHDVAGYWDFMASPEAENILAAHKDSFMTLMYTKDRSLWIPHTSTLGGLKKWLGADKKTELASFVSQEEYEFERDEFYKHSLHGPLSYYRVLRNGLDAEDSLALYEKGVGTITKPVFGGACLYDNVCLASALKEQMQKTCTDLTLKEYESGHWLMMESRQELARDLVEWLSSL